MAQDLEERIREIEKKLDLIIRTACECPDSATLCHEWRQTETMLYLKCAVCEKIGR